ncbi:hypothetical protein B0H11DRAFT_2363791 [Mycena galericulata]|nr:hypothetical protein B0H11DRAFT_2363791 [Mycena galericulata]
MVAVIDRYTHYVVEYMERIKKTSHDTMRDLFDAYDPARIHSDPGVRSRKWREVLDAPAPGAATPWDEESVQYAAGESEATETHQHTQARRLDS